LPKGPPYKDVSRRIPPFRAFIRPVGLLEKVQVNMTKGFQEEFATIEILINSDTKTGRTDTFIVAFTKLEKLARRIFAYMIYQYPAFNLSHYKEILAVIASKNFLDFDNFIKGFDAIYPKSFESIIGSALYTSFMKTDFPRIKNFRNKIFHGQPTGESLSADDLKTEIEILQNWCLRLAESMMAEIYYDGLGWNSFRKNADQDLASNYKTSISGIKELDTFIETNMK
jgi:hypothetical protein